MKKFLTIVAGAVLLFNGCGSSFDREEARDRKAAEKLASRDPKLAAQSGELSVGTIPIAAVHDEARNRNVALNIEYPITGGPYPLIIFSHEFGHSKDSYVSLTESWVSHGYVVIRPAHADAVMTTPGSSGTALRDPQETYWDREREPQWRDRARDITLILDQLDSLQRQFPELKGKIDRTRIGVGGHGYGAFTTMLLTGMTPFAPQAVTLADPRVRAGLALSPQGIGTIRGLTAESWRGVKTPMLFMSGSRDTGRTGETAVSRRDPFDYSPAGDKYLIFIQGAQHAAFGGAYSSGYGRDILDPRNQNQYPGTANGPGTRTVPMDDRYDRRHKPEAGEAAQDRRAFFIVKSASLSFWNAYLKDDTKARDRIQKLASPGSIDVLTK